MVAADGSALDDIVMPYLDRTGPRGLGPMTGRARGLCRRGFGAGGDTIPSSAIVDAERPPTAEELALWERAEQLMKRVVLLAYSVRLKHAQILAAAKHAAKYKMTLNISEMADLEQRMIAALKEVEQLRQYHADVNGLHLGVRMSADGKDLDIVSAQPMSMGAIWIPIVLGAIVLIGIIARWIHLETEVQEISNQYNGVITQADNALCQDPSSEMCQSWNQQKAVGDYYKRQTLIDKVESAVKSVGSSVKTGLSWGLALAVPLLIFLYAPRRSSKNG